MILVTGAGVAYCHQAGPGPQPPRGTGHGKKQPGHCSSGGGVLEAISGTFSLISSARGRGRGPVMPSFNTDPVLV